MIADRSFDEVMNVENASGKEMIPTDPERERIYKIHIC